MAGASVEKNEVKKARIDFIDLAKGFCIILVVFTHVNGFCFNDQQYILGNTLRIFRMPLYFFLSGLFFKQYEGFIGFLKRKINKLLIPFLFFFLTTSIGLPFALQCMGYPLRNTEGIGFHSLYAFIYPETFSNTPIWFLMCLFVVNMLFYTVFSLVKILLKQKTEKFCIWVVAILCLGIGTAGCYLDLYHTNLPMYIDSSMTALPFFAGGFIMCKFTNILYPNKFDKYNLLMVVCLFILTFSFAGRVDYRGNHFDVSIWSLYICGFAGTLGIMFLSKMLHKLPLISFWGRYSIMILCTHILVMNVVSSCVKKLSITVWPQIFLTTIIVMMSYLVVIPFMKKFMPHVTAQKDVIQVPVK